MRRSIAFAAVILAVCVGFAAAVFSGAGAATPSHSRMTIHLLSKQTGARVLHLGGPGVFVPGNMLLATDTDFNPRTHRIVATDVGTLQVDLDHHIQFTGTMHWPHRGVLTMSGVLLHSANGSADQVAVTGGTGQFAGVRGVLIDVHTAGNRPDIVTIHLRR